jgi:hypothetical protein
MRKPPRELFMREPPEGSGSLYRNLIHPRRPVEVAARQRCEDMWRLFEPLADPNFLERPRERRARCQRADPRAGT